ncbi:MAG: nucleotidyl transferase AbiEii/AbiGii toxin family protein, partial [Nanobdellota archaeon]
MALKKIIPKRIKEIAAIQGFADELLTKDYYVTAILYLLKDIDGIYFKGGTALQKIFLDYSRLSEDVDYTVTGNLANIKEDIIQIVLESGLFEAVTEDKNVDGFVRVVLHYRNLADRKDTVFIDLNKRAKLTEKPETHTLPHFYDEIPSFSVKTLAAKELFAEKLAATIGRNQPRDHFDIYMILKKGLTLDYTIAKKKCEASGYEFDIEKMFNKAKKLHNKWEEDMLPLLKELIEFN